MRILVIGGTGLIGMRVTEVLRERGHTVATTARGPGPGVDHALDVATAPVEEIRPLVDGADGVVFAARTDDQRPLRRPIHPALHHDMVDPVVRLFTAARDAGVTRGVVMGSYYTYFHRLHPQWRLPDRHVYVRCRIEQAAQARAAAGPGLPVAVLELPFVFGRSGDRLPNWAPALDRWVRSRAPLAVPAGGPAAVGVRTVAETAADALEGVSGADLPVADENLAWTDMIDRPPARRGDPGNVRRTAPRRIVV